MTEPGDVLPCPWCGSTQAPHQVLTDGYKWGALTCSECGATAPEVRTGYAEKDAWYEDAVEAWNKRPGAQEDPPYGSFVLYDKTRTLLTIYRDGRLEFAPEAYPEEAVKALVDVWRAYVTPYTCTCQEEQGAQDG